jgi:hypothetical protein
VGVYISSPSLSQPFSLPSLGAGLVKKAYAVLSMLKKLLWNLPVEVVALSFCYTKATLVNNMVQYVVIH